MTEDDFMAAAERAREELYLTDDRAAFRAVMRRLGFCEFEIEDEIGEITA